MVTQVARLIALVVAALGLLLASGCVGQKGLSKEEVDGRAQEYFLRGMDLYQRGEFRGALESFRLAKAYDPQGTNASIADMIEKSEAKLRIGNPAAAAGPALGMAAAPTPVAALGLEGPFQTFHSRLYPYSVNVPESWAIEPGGAKVANTPADLLMAPLRGSRPVRLTVVAHLLPVDVDRRGYVEANIKLLRSQGVQPDELGKRVVDGMEASLLKARVTNEQGKLINTFAIFANDRIGWGLTFSASIEESDRLQPLFQRMLDSFHLAGQQTI